MELGGRVCLVTGASSGIGRATALALAGRGATLALAARRSELLERVADEVRATSAGYAGARDRQPNGRAASIHVADLSDPAEALDLADEVLDRHGRVDVLVNNAGVRVDGSLSDVDLEALDRVFQVNALSPFVLAGRLAPLMAERGEGVVAALTTAIAGGRRGLGAYAASKAALESITQTLRQELGGRGVAVFAFDPGWVRTAMSPDGREEPEAAAARLVDHIAAGRGSREVLR